MASFDVVNDVVANDVLANDVAAETSLLTLHFVVDQRAPGINSKRTGLHHAIDDHSRVSTIARLPATEKKALNLLRRPSTSSKGKTLPVYRAGFSRTSFLVVALFLTVAAAGVSAREFRAADVQAENYPTVQALRFMGRIIAERSGGRHQIRIFHSGELGGEKETIEQTRAGAIDLNRINVALIGTFVPAVNVLAMPFLFRSSEHLHKVLDGPIGNEILNSFKPHGFVGLTFYDSGARSIYNSVRPVRSPADLKGLRIRVQQSELMSNMVRALGAEPVALPYGQVLTGLATRLIDGAENNWPSFVTTDHYRYAGFYTLTEHSMSPEVLVMSQKAWQSLSADDQKMFREAAVKSSQFMREKWRDLEERSRQEAEAAGVTIVKDFDRTPFEAAMADLYRKAQRDRAVMELIERIRQVE